MSMLAAAGNINFTGSWALCDPTSELDSQSANAFAPTTQGATSRSASFTPGAITIDAILIQIASRVASPTGTLQVELYNSTLASYVASTIVTINVSDIQNHSTTALPGGWILLKLGAPVLLIAATAYMVDIITSNASQVRCYAGSGNDWSRELRTTTTQAPAVNDNLIVAGEKTAAGAMTTRTVTFDNTASTTFGSAASKNSFCICDGGTLTLQTTASTTYLLNLLGSFVAYAGSTTNFGTVGTPLPSTSTFTLTFQNAANVDCGMLLQSLCTVNANGVTKTSWTKMSADKAAAQTVIPLLDTTGWAISDTLAFAPTSRTIGDAETKVVSTVDSATQVTLTAGITNAHTGTNDANGDIRCEVGNLTRNVKIQGNSSTLGAYVTLAASATATLNYVEFTKLGSATVNKRGIDIGTLTGSCLITGCSLHDCTVASSYGFNLQNATGALTGTVTLTSNVTYNVANVHIINIALTSGFQTFDQNLAIKNIDSGVFMMDFNTPWSVVTGNVAAGGIGKGISFSETPVKNFSNNVAHSNASVGINWNGNVNAITLATGNRSWRNGTYGLQASGMAAQVASDWASFTAFGNATAGIGILGVVCGKLNFSNLVLDAGTTLTQPIGISVNAGTNIAEFSVESGTFGSTNAHATGDISLTVSTGVQRINLYNCLLSSTVEVVNPTSVGGYIASQKHDQVAGSTKVWFRYGVVTNDTTIFNTASPSSRLTPNNASNKLESGYFSTAVASGATCTVSVRAYKSVIGDGAAYNGNQTRLLVEKNVAAGISADTVLATGAAANGSWETLSGTTAAVTDNCNLTFRVDCDGTTGWANVDDFTTTSSNDNGTTKYAIDGLPGAGVMAAGGVTVPTAVFGTEGVLVVT